MIATEINILPFYTSLGLQHHNKWYAYGRYYCQPTPVGKLIPFQLRRAQTGAAITTFSVVEVSTGTETDVLALATGAGLEVVQFVSDGYDLIIYPGTLTIGSFNVGRHYLKMSDGTNTWYSEVFNFVDSVAATRLVMVEWWNDGNFCYPSGHVRYNYPYKSRVYLKTDIGKPTYPFQEEVEERNGKRFKLKQISSKQYKFVFLGPEYLVDAFRTAPLHDFCEITNYNDNRTYTLDELIMNDPEWQDNGDLAAVTVEFQTDTVIVSSGKGLTSLTYEVGAGECIAVDYTAVAEITEGTKDYGAYRYFDNSSSAYVDFEDGDYVLIIADTGERELWQFQSAPAGYNPVTPSADEVVYNADDNRYYFWHTDEFIRPKITDYSGGTLTGLSFPGALVEIYASDGSTNTLQETITQAQLEAGYAISFDPGTVYIYFIAVTAACPSFAPSTRWIIDGTGIGVGFDTIETDLVVY